MIYFAGIIVKKFVLLNYPSRRRGRTSPTASRARTGYCGREKPRVIGLGFVARAIGPTSLSNEILNRWKSGKQGRWRKLAAACRVNLSPQMLMSQSYPALWARGRDDVLNVDYHS